MSSEIRIIIRAINASQAAFGQAKTDIAALAAEIAAAGAILTGFALIVKKAFDLGAEGAQLERLAATGDKVAQQFGGNMTEAVNKIKAASLDTITTQQAILEANRAMFLGVATDADTMAQLVQVAAIRGRAFGLSTTDAFDRITLGIGRLSTRILDDIGIVVDGQTAYANYAASIGKTADELTEAQKRQALTNAILADGNTILAAQGGLIDDNASKIERFKTHVIDAWNAFEKLLAGPTTRVIEALDITTFGYFKAQEALRAHNEEVLKSAKTYEDYVAEINRVESVTKDNFNSIKLHTEAEYDDAQATKQSTAMNVSLAFSLSQVGALLKEQADLLQKADEARKGLMGIGGNADKLGLDSAAGFADKFNVAVGSSQPFLDQFRLELGLTSKDVLAFRDAMIAATDPKSAGGIRILAEEFQKAFEPLRIRELAKQAVDLEDELNKKLASLEQERKNTISKLDQELARDLENQAIALARKLEDIEIDRTQALEDVQKTSDRKKEKEEDDYQRRIQKILEKFAIARLHALIDLDARALFEAELTRDQELKDAEAERKQRHDDAEKDTQQRIDDINAEYDKRRERAEQDAERERTRTEEDNARRRQDAQNDSDRRAEEARTFYDAEYAALVEKLELGTSAMQDAYDQRLQSTIDYFNALKAIYDSQDFGDYDIPPPPHLPPGGHTGHITGGEFIIPPGYGNEGWNLGGGNTASSGEKVTITPAGGSSEQHIRVTLDVRGDGEFARLLRSSVLDTFVDVMAE